MRLIFLALMLCCCGSVGKISPQTADKTALEIKFDNYLKWSNDRVNNGDWLPDTECDGLLFNGFWATIGGKANILLAHDASDFGKWYRSPSHTCYPEHSKSSISRDMFLGLSFWIYANRRLDLIEQIISYGKNHRDFLGQWIMGEGDISRTAIRSNFQGTLFEIMWQLGGHNSDARNNQQLWNPTIKGYESHLQMMHIFLRQHLGMTTQPYVIEILKNQEKLHPRNALLKAILKKDQDAIAILMDENLFPNDRLPSSSDRCGFYLWQRDGDSKDWLPCSENKVHSGLDFLIASAIILGKIPQHPKREEQYTVFYIGEDF